MRTSIILSVFTALAGISRVVLAQPVSGYNVTWGMLSVPISPWISVAIGLLLLLATYAFIRRHAGQGLFMLATATLVAALSLHTAETANAVPTPFYLITTPSGSDFYNCLSPPSYIGYENDTGNPLKLTLTAVGGAPFSTPLGTASPQAGPSCHAGDQQLPAGGSCYMPCGAG